MSATQTQSAATALPAFVPANMFSLTGGGLHIGYRRQASMASRA